MVNAMMAANTPKVRYWYLGDTAVCASTGFEASASGSKANDVLIASLISGSYLARVFGDLFGHRIELSGFDGIDPGDPPSDDELRQREQQANVDRAPPRALVDVGEPCCTDRQQEVADHSKNHHPPN